MLDPVANPAAPRGLPNRFEQFYREGAKEEIKKDFQKLNACSYTPEWVPAGKWKFFKLDPDAEITKNILTVLKTAEKIRALLEENELDDYITPPQEHLYRDETGNMYAALPNEKYLTDQVVAPASDHVERQLARSSQELGKQDVSPLDLLGKPLLSALADGVDKRELRSHQSGSLAKLVVLGFFDLKHDNLFFDVFGKVAIGNLNPSQQVSHFSPLRSDEEAFQPVRALGWLKSCTKGLARKAVEKVEKGYVFRTIAQLATTTLILSYGAYFCVKVMLRMPLDKRTQILGIGLTVIPTCTQNMFLIRRASKLYKIWCSSKNRKSY